MAKNKKTTEYLIEYVDEYGDIQDFNGHDTLREAERDYETAKIPAGGCVYLTKNVRTWDLSRGELNARIVEDEYTKVKQKTV